ncbi:MAG TPA: DUF6152 family protein [Gammaproteobacteria bacterium]|jgi:hypothetical protein
MQRTTWLWLGACLAAVLPLSASAHHAFAAEFDRNKPIELTGTVTKVEWMNPHARIYVDAPDPELENQIVNWDFELGSPNVLMRQGWSRNSLKEGQTVTVAGWRARNHAHVANARSVTDANGKRLFAGSSSDTETTSPAPAPAAQSPAAPETPRPESQ